MLVDGGYSIDSIQAHAADVLVIQQVLHDQSQTLAVLSEPSSGTHPAANLPLMYCYGGLCQPYV